jgi:alpha-D-xyloside xylohydrolase
VPWLIDGDDPGPEGATAVLRGFVRLKRVLMPYLYAQAVEAATNGWPVSLRAMCLEFPEDPTSWYLDRQFMLGSSVLVAPVFTENGNVQFYLPEGKWTSWWDDSKFIDGPRWVRETHGFNSLPVYVREGTVMPLGRNEGDEFIGFGYDWVNEGGSVKLYHVKEGCKAVLVNTEGELLRTLEVGENKTLKDQDSILGKWKVITISQRRDII